MIGNKRSHSTRRGRAAAPLSRWPNRSGRRFETTHGARPSVPCSPAGWRRAWQVSNPSPSRSPLTRPTTVAAAIPVIGVYHSDDRSQASARHLHAKAFNSFARLSAASTRRRPSPLPRHCSSTARATRRAHLPTPDRGCFESIVAVDDVDHQQVGSCRPTCRSLASVLRSLSRSVRCVAALLCRVAIQASACCPLLIPNERPEPDPVEQRRPEEHPDDEHRHRVIPAGGQQHEQKASRRATSNRRH